jgi:hypothetical protein
MAAMKRIRGEHWLSLIDDTVNSFALRVILSVAIVVSVLPSHLDEQTRQFFLLFFGSEACFRLLLLVHKSMKLKGRFMWGSGALWVADLLAVISFLPLPGFDADEFRYGRLIRLALLLFHWGPLIRDFWTVATKRDRLSQIVMVMSLSLILSALGASAVRLAALEGVDVDGDGVKDVPTREVELFWWAFRQVQDPGNLIPSSEHVGLLTISLVLTLGGLFLVAFLIGIGTTLVEELLQTEQQRRVDLYGHTVVLNIDEHARQNVDAISAYLKKQESRRRVVLLGSSDKPAFLFGGYYRDYIYRQGQATSSEALALLDLEHARRVGIIAPGTSPEADAQVVTSVLQVRERAPELWMVAEINRPTHMRAIHEAGGPRTNPVPARRLASLALCQALIDPLRAALFQEWVSLVGQEIYSVVFGSGRAQNDEPEIHVESFAHLRWMCWKEKGCLLLGYLGGDNDPHEIWNWGMNAQLNPPADFSGPIRGVVGLAYRFDDFLDASRQLTRYGRNRAREAVPPLDVLACAVPRAAIETILILGFHDHTVEMVWELFRSHPEAKITVVGQDEEQRTHIRHLFLEENLPRGACYEKISPKLLHLCIPGESSCGQVHIRVADRYADALYRPDDRGGRVGNAFDYDALFLLNQPSNHGQTDSATLLGVLKLMGNWPSTPKKLNKIIVELSFFEGGDYWRRRIENHVAKDAFVWVPTETLRTDILNHAFFVPSLANVLHNLLTAGREQIVKIDAALMQKQIPTLQDSTYGDLLMTLGSQSPPLVILGFETDAGDFRLVPDTRDDTRLRDMRSLLCIETRPDEKGSFESADS